MTGRTSKTENDNRSEQIGKMEYINRPKRTENTDNTDRPKKSSSLIVIAAAVFIAALFIIPFLFAGMDPNSIYTDRNMTAPVFYLAMMLISAAILIYYTANNTRKFLWIILLFVSVTVANLGYLAISMASNVTEALLANRISYLGNVYMLLFLLLTIVNACGVRYNKAFNIILFAISSIMYVFAATQGYLDIFYRNVSFEIVDGFARILKNYGPMHTAYIIYIFAYFLLIVGTVIYAVIKKKVTSAKYILAIVIMGLINVTIWFVEQFTDNRLEYLACSYVINEFIMLWIYGKLVKEGMLDTFVIKMTFTSEDQKGRTVDIVVADNDSSRVLVRETEVNVDISKLSDDRLREIIRQIESSSRLTEREMEVAILLLKNLRRKEMASNLCVSEDTVKTHTSHVFNKLEISSRKELKDMAEEYMEHEKNE